MPTAAGPRRGSLAARCSRRIVTIQPAAGIQTFPLVSSVRTSKGWRPCFAAVDRLGAHRGEVLAPVRVRMHPGDLLLDLRRADVAFGRIVVEGRPQVGGEAQV